jgi:large subunit ribosomal protein L28
MTGYGEARATIKDFTIICRARSVNHRFLDVKTRLPRGENTFLDLAIRKQTSELFRRGAIDVSLSVETNEAALQQLINFKTAEAYWAAAQTLSHSLAKKKKAAAPKPLTLEGLLRLPGVVTTNRSDGFASSEEALSTLEPETIVERAVKPALMNLRKSRVTEGKRLASHLLELTSQLEKHATDIRSLEGPEKERARALVTERIQATLTLLQGNPQSADFAARLREEAAFWVERRDFDEERVRLEMHLKTLRNILMGKEEVSGRKLEFLHQELLREVNTLGTKSQSTAITGHTIELKTILERLREQLANVE